MGSGSRTDRLKWLARRPWHTGAVAAIAAVTAVGGLAVVPQALAAGTSGAPTAAGHAFGLRPTTGVLAATTGLRNLRAGSMLPLAVPASVDLTGYAIAPGNQGPHGSCASWTTAYTLTGWQANYSNHAGAPFNPMFVYNQVNGGSDTNGTTFYDNWRILQNEGDVEASAWTHSSDDYLSQPTQAELTNAAQHRMTAPTTLYMGQHQGSAAQTAIQTALASNDPVALGIPVYSKFEYLNSTNSTFMLADANTSLLGYHAVAVLGYNATGVIVENSWGTGWGRGGFATLGWDFVNADSFEAYAVGSFQSNPNAPAPMVSGLSKHVISATGDTLTVTGTNLNTVDSTSSSAVQLVSTADSTNLVSATVTSATGTSLTVSVPSLADGQYRVVVTGSGGSSSPNGTNDLLTAAHPSQVVLGQGQVGRSNASTWVVLYGLGFGTSSTAFAANAVTATLDGQAASVGWISDTSIRVLVPAKPAGYNGTLVVSRSGVAASPVTVPYLPPLPTVTGLNPKRVDAAGGSSVTVTARYLDSSGDSVSLVSVSSPGTTLSAQVTGRTATAITFTVPAGAAGDYHVLVTTTGGTSTAASTDVLGLRTALTGSTTATAAAGSGGTFVPVAGSGFGTTTAAFQANRITASVLGRPATVKWVSDGALSVVMPAGTPGAAAPIVLLHDSVPGAPISGVTYVASISGNTIPAGPVSGGWTTTLTGAGFAGSASWALLDQSGNTVATLPVVTSTSALTASAGAVLINSPTTATVKLPAATSAGIYQLRFDPTGYPNASFGFTSKAVVVYSDLG